MGTQDGPGCWRSYEVTSGFLALGDRKADSLMHKRSEAEGRECTQLSAGEHTGWI